jgi:hypothetical protein
VRREKNPGKKGGGEWWDVRRTPLGDFFFSPYARGLENTESGLNIKQGGECISNWKVAKMRHSIDSIA